MDINVTNQSLCYEYSVSLGIWTKPYNMLSIQSPWKNDQVVLAMQKYGYMKMPDICLCPVLPKSMNQAQTVTPVLKSNIQIDAKIDVLLLLLPLMSL